LAGAIELPPDRVGLPTEMRGITERLCGRVARPALIAAAVQGWQTDDQR